MLRNNHFSTLVMYNFIQKSNFNSLSVNGYSLKYKITINYCHKKKQYEQKSSEKMQIYNKNLC